MRKFNDIFMKSAVLTACAVVVIHKLYKKRYYGSAF